MLHRNHMRLIGLPAGCHAAVPVAAALQRLTALAVRQLQPEHLLLSAATMC